MNFPGLSRSTIVALRQQWARNPSANYWFKSSSTKLKVPDTRELQTADLCKSKRKSISLSFIRTVLPTFMHQHLILCSKEKFYTSSFQMEACGLDLALDWCERKCWESKTFIYIDNQLCVTCLNSDLAGRRSFFVTVNKCLNSSSKSHMRDD